MLILKVITALALLLLPVAVIVRDWKYADRRTKRHHNITRCIVVSWVLASFLGVFLVVSEMLESSRKATTLIAGQHHIRTSLAGLSDHSKMATALSASPVVHISEWCRSDDDAGGTFTFSITNSGVNDVVDLRFYRDCYVHSRDKRGTLVLQRFGDFSNKPICTMQSLGAGQSETFSVDIRDVYKEMIEFAYKDRKNPKMSIVRLGAHFKRKADGKLFKYYRMYLIFGPATQLISPDTRGNNLSGYFDLPIDEVKQKLNCTE